MRANQQARSAQADRSETDQPSPAPATTGIGDESLAKLERLAQLRQQGVLTEQEFADQKAKLLGE